MSDVDVTGPAEGEVIQLKFEEPGPGGVPPRAPAEAELPTPAPPGPGLPEPITAGNDLPFVGDSPEAVVIPIETAR